MKNGGSVLLVMMWTFSIAACMSLACTQGLNHPGYVLNFLFVSEPELMGQGGGGAH